MRDCLVPGPGLPLATRVWMSTSNFTDGNLERRVHCVTLAQNRRSPMQPILSPDRCPLGTRLAPGFLVKRLGPSFPPPALCERGGTTFALRSSGARDDPLLSR